MLRLHSAPKRLGATLALATLLLAASTAVAHDFWLIPYLGAFVGDSVAIDGKSGTRFPGGSAVQPTRVADAWLVNAAGKAKLTDFSVQDGALRLSHRPAAGQYRVAVGLTARTTRSTPEGLARYLRAEGGAAEADRLERANSFAGMDSVVFHGASYAATVVQVGRGGPRAYASAAGFPLEFVPLADPAHLHVGDTLHVRVLGGGAAAAGIGVDARSAGDTTAAAAEAERVTSPWITVLTDANGVAHILLSKSGPWLLRSAWVGRRAGGAANEFDVARSTFVLGVAGHH